MKTLTATDLLSFVSLIKAEEESVQYERDHFFMLFRGQPANEPLLPKIARDLKWIKEFQIPQRLKLRKLEEYMLQEFKRRGHPYLSNKPESNWDWLIHAQHHGMATRLLDWTENPLVALYFAVRDHNCKDRFEAVVWLMKIRNDEIIVPLKKLDPFNQKGTRVFRPSFVSRRLEAQNGWFSIHQYLDGKDHFVPLEKNSRFKSKLIKLLIPLRHASGILEDLDLCGINSATLFPDLDGVSDYINWKKGAVQCAKIRMPQEKINDL